MKYIDKTGTPVPEILKSKGEKETLKILQNIKRIKLNIYQIHQGLKRQKITLSQIQLK